MGESEVIFNISVPNAGMFNNSVRLKVRARLDVDRLGRPELVGRSCASDQHREGALGDVSIGWRPSSRSVRCRFSSGVDYLSDFDFSSPVAKPDAMVLRQPMSTPAAIVASLIASAGDFEIEIE
jgi:hypothetical protein